MRRRGSAELSGAARAAPSANVLEVSDELAGAFLPGIAQRKGAAFVARHDRARQGKAAPQVFIERTDRIIADQRSFGRTETPRSARRSRALQLHDADGVSQAWEYEHVGRREVRASLPFSIRPP